MSNVEKKKSQKDNQDTLAFDPWLRAQLLVTIFSYVALSLTSNNDSFNNAALLTALVSSGAVLTTNIEKKDNNDNYYKFVHLFYFCVMMLFSSFSANVMDADSKSLYEQMLFLAPTLMATVAFTYKGIADSKIDPRS